MKSEDWPKVEKLYYAALERPENERAAFLAEACAGDESLRREVESLLVYQTRAGDFIEAPALQVAAQQVADRQPRIGVGHSLGPYQILSLLGKGGMGEVYRARDSRLGREVAVKVLPPIFAADADRLRRFEQEARTAGMLNHPNILTVYDVGTHEGSPYLVSELLEGQTLRGVIEGTALSPRQALDYARQVALGLAAAHEKGVVHRDLKPENLFITRDERLKILDFGLAKLTQPKVASESLTEAPTASGQTQSGVILGTAGYMSPEQVRGPSVDHRSDLFAFGAILYEMLTGRRAFRRNSAVETMNAILTEEPPDLAETNQSISPALARVVRRCLEKNPERRFQSASDLAFALESLAEASGSGKVWQPAAPRSSAPVLSARRRMLGLALIMLLGLTFFLGRYTGKAPPASPSFNRLTFRRGNLSRARLAPDGQTVVYTASWEGKPRELFTTRLGNPESRSLGLPSAGIAAISSTGEMAIQLIRSDGSATLAQVPLVGGVPRELLDHVQSADWAPDGKSLAVIRFFGPQRRIEFPIGRTVYETQDVISDLRLSPKGDLIAFHERSGTGRWSVAVVDLGGKKKTLSEGWRSIQGIAWAPAGDEVWFTAGLSGDHALYAVDLSGRQRLVVRVPGKLAIQDISRDGRVLLEHDLNRTSMMSLPPGETKERDLSWFDSSTVRNLSADGKTVLFDERGEGGGENSAIYLRGTDGSPAVRLGEGRALGLSPDGKWVVSLLTQTSTQQLALLPTGAGETKLLERGGIESYQAQSVAWFPDGRRLLFTGREMNRKPRLYTQEVTGGPPQPFLAEELSAGLISPDGKLAAAFSPDGSPGGKAALYPLDGGPPRPLPGIDPGESALGWSSDGRALYLARLRGLPAKVYRYDLATGRQELWKEIMPPDPDQISGIVSLALTPDGQSYVYSYSHVLSTLYLVEGLK